MSEAEVISLLKSYVVCKRFLKSQVHAKEFFDPDNIYKVADQEQYEARMNVVESLIRFLEPSDEYTILHLHYIKGISVERCAECMFVSRATAFRMLKRAHESILNLVNKGADSVENRYSSLMRKDKQIEEMAKILQRADIQSKCLKVSCKECEYYDIQFGLCVEHRRAETIYNAGYRKQEWISVEERLPDGYGVFLVAVKAKLLWKTEWEYCVDMARFNVSKIPSVNGWDYESGDGYEYIVTHWMPLPEAPKMKGGAEE